LSVQIPIRLSPKNRYIVNSVINTFSWTNQGTSPTNYQVIIRENAGNTIIHNSGVVSSTSNTYDLPANSLSSNLDEDLSWTVTVNSGIAGEQTSNSVFFRAYSSPTISITDPVFPAPTVPSQDYTFVGSYSQAEDLELESFQFILYDSTGTTILQDSGLVYGANPEYEFTGMGRGETFQVEYKSFPSSSLGEFTTGKLTFDIANYTVPDDTPAIEATPNNSEGITVVDWANLVLLQGTTVGTTSYTTGKFDQGLLVDDNSSYLQFEYDVDGDDFTLSCYTKRKFTLDGTFIEAYDSSPSLDLEVGYDLATNRLYVIKDGITTYGNVVVPNTLNFYSSGTLNAYASQTFSDLGNDDFDSNFMFLFLTKDRLYIKLDTGNQTLVDTFTYTRTDSTTFSRFRFIGENIFDHIHMYDKEFTLTEIESEDTEVETTFGISTSYLAKLNGDLDAGNISTGVTPTGWRVKRKPVGEDITITLVDLPLSTNTYTDTTGANGVEYEYAVFTLSANGESLGQIDTAELSFYGVVLTDGTNSYLIDAGWNGFTTNSTNHVNPYIVYSNNFSDKPIVSYAVANYRTGGVTGVLYQCVEDEFVATTKDYFDGFKDFINDGQSKILKDTLGNVITVVTHDLQDAVDQKLSKTYNGDIIQPIEISFSWTEVESD